MIYCNKCGGTLNAGGLCPDCGAQAFPPAPVTQPVPQPAGESPGGFPGEPKASPPSRSSFPPLLIVVLLAVVGILAIAVLIYFAANSRPRPGPSNSLANVGAPTSTVNSNLDFRVSNSNANNSRVNANSVPTASPKPSLPDSFQHDYQGTMGRGFSLSVTLTRSGSTLSGRASTSGSTGSSWDRLEGSIETDGHFTLVGYERGGGSITGDYEGWIRDRTVNGSYTSRLNQKTARFQLSQQD